MTGEMPDTVQIKDNQLKVLKVDEAVNTTFVCEVKNRIGPGKDQVTAFVRGEFKDKKRAPQHRHPNIYSNKRSIGQRIFTDLWKTLLNMF